MAKLIFKYTEGLNEIREAHEIEFSVPNDMNINEFKIMCVRLASALGYHEQSINNSFGELNYGEDKDEQLKQLLNDIYEGSRKNNN